MDYQQAIEILNSFIDYERIEKYTYENSFKLDRMVRLLELLNNPHNGLKYIHVAGTKGKGSVCAMVAYILREAGFKVGLYTSPHLSDFRERIRVLDPVCPEEIDFEGMIGEDEICSLINQMKPQLDIMADEFKDEPLTFFEVYTALMFLYFKKMQVDYAILEVGLGGRLDATNAIDNPLACCITPISLDHTDKLGMDIKSIATEKSKIIKKGCKVICAQQRPEALSQIQKACKRNKAELFLIEKNEGLRLKVSLLGEHQLINAACAVKIVECLPVKISEQLIHQGLSKVRWPGRLEVIDQGPQLVVDGAQNVASIGVLAGQIRKAFNFDRLILVIGFCKDKDIEGICEILLSIADGVIVTKAKNPRAARPDAISEIIKRRNSSMPVTLTDDVNRAMESAYQKASEKDLILITGSLFIVGEARELKSSDEKYVCK